MSYEKKSWINFAEYLLFLENHFIIKQAKRCEIQKLVRTEKSFLKWKKKWITALNQFVD